LDAATPDALFAFRVDGELRRRLAQSMAWIYRHPVSRQGCAGTTNVMLFGFQKDLKSDVPRMRSSVAAKTLVAGIF
jgi:hypothetical protein